MDPSLYSEEKRTDGVVYYGFLSYDFIDFPVEKSYRRLQFETRVLVGISSVKHSEDISLRGKKFNAAQTYTSSNNTERAKHKLMSALLIEIRIALNLLKNLLTLS